MKQLDLTRLSKQELEIVKLLTEGLPNRFIARRLKIAEATVKVHMKYIFLKTNVRNRTHLAILADRELRNDTARI